MMNNTNEELFEKAPVPRAILTMAIPSMISMLVTVIYNMADTFFIGQTGDAMQVAAVSLANPIFLIFTAFGNLYGIGGTSVISRALGEKRPQRARHTSAFCCYAALGTGVLIGIVLLIWTDGIVSLIGGSADTAGFAGDYLRYLAVGGPFIIFSLCFGNIVRSEGAARTAMAGNLIGTITNIILDPVFILAFGWGVKGAAVATVIGNTCAALFYLSYFLRKKSSLSIRPRDFMAGDKIATGVIAIGIPASLNTAMMSVAHILMNVVLAKYGDIPVAAMGIALRTNMIVVMLQMGLCMSIQPLIGYAYGSNNRKRLMQVFRTTLAFTVILGIILTGIMIFARRTVVGAFIDDEEVIEIGIRMVVALQLSGPFIGILFTCTSTIQAMGKALPSLFLTFCRQGLVLFPLIFIFDRFIGMDGVIYAQPIADYVSIVIAVIICMVLFRRMRTPISS